MKRPWIESGESSTRVTVLWKHKQFKQCKRLISVIKSPTCIFIGENRIIVESSRCFWPTASLQTYREPPMGFKRRSATERTSWVACLGRWLAFTLLSTVTRILVLIWRTAATDSARKEAYGSNSAFAFWDKMDSETQSSEIVIFTWRTWTDTPIREESMFNITILHIRCERLGMLRSLASKPRQQHITKACTVLISFGRWRPNRLIQFMKSDNKRRFDWREKTENYMIGSQSD